MDLVGTTGCAEKLPTGSRKKKHHAAVDVLQDLPTFPTNFGAIVKTNPPLAPPNLTRLTGGQGPKQNTGRVKTMLRVCPVDSNYSSFLKCDVSRKQVTVYDPSCLGHSSYRRPGAGAPKIFTFDGVFSQDSSLAEICATSVVEVLQAVVHGSDGCICCYGHARLGKTYTMLGVDDSPQNLGIVPCAISWLFRLIEDLKEKTGSRFSVRVSAVEVTGREETLKDLLANIDGTLATGGGNPAGAYLRDDLIPVTGPQLGNWHEIRAPSAEHAASYLDAAIAARTLPESEEDTKNSHLLFTLHIYQYRIDKTNDGPNEVIGGHTRLHLLDLGSCTKDHSGTCLSLSTLGSVLLAIANGQRYIPHQSSKLTQLLKESFGGSTPCYTCMIIHVSPAMQAYNETLQVIQLAAKFHRIGVRKKSKLCSGSSDDSSTDGSQRSCIHSSLRIGASSGSGSLGALSDPDYTSSSEQSCDTVIYVGKNGRLLSDRELTDNEGPPVVLPVCPVDQTKPEDSGKRVPSSVVKKTLNSTTLKPVVFNKSPLATSDLKQPAKYVTSKSPVQVTSCLESMQLMDNIRYRPPGGEVCPVFEERLPADPSATESVQVHDLLSPKVVEKSRDGLTANAAAGKPRRLKQSRHKGLEKSFQKVEELWIDGPNMTMVAGNQAKNDETWVDGPKDFLPESTFVQSLSSPGTHRSPAFRKGKLDAHCDSVKAGGKREELERSGIDLTSCASSHNSAVPENQEADNDPVIPDQSASPKFSHSDSKKMRKSVKHGFSPKDRWWKKQQTASAAPANGSSLPISSSLDQSILSTQSGPHTDQGHLASNATVPVILSGDRTAEWVRSVQDAAASRYVHLLHARKQFFRSMHPQGKGKCRLKSEDRIRNGNTLAVFDHPLMFVDVDSEQDTGNNSPPPDYASCIADGQPVLDINENKASVDCDNSSEHRGTYASSHGSDIPDFLQSPNSVFPANSSGSNADTNGFPLYGNGQKCRQGNDSLTEQSRLCSNATRLCNPDGASNPNLAKTILSPSTSLNDTLDGVFLDSASSSLSLNFDSQDRLCSKTTSNSYVKKIPVLAEGASCSVKHSHVLTATECHTDNSGAVDRHRTDIPDAGQSVVPSKQKYSAKTPSASSLLPPKAKASPKRDHFFGMSLFSCVAASSCHILQKLSFRSSSFSSCSKSHQSPSSSKSHQPQDLRNQDAADVLHRDAEGLISAPSTNGSNRSSLGLQTSASIDCMSSCGSMAINSSGVQQQDLSLEMLEMESLSSVQESNVQELSKTYVSSECLVLKEDLESTSGVICVQPANRSHLCLQNSSDVSPASSSDSGAIPPTKQSSCAHMPECLPKDCGIQNDQGPSDSVHLVTDVNETSEHRKRQIRIQELLCWQEKLKQELSSAKKALMVQPESWSYDLHVAEHMDRDDPGYLEALENETAILEKRVTACKSRIMVVTVFDVTA